MVRGPCGFPALSGRARGGRASVLGLILALGLMITPAVAAALICTAQTDRARVSPGEQILLTISLDGTFQDVAPPVLPSLEGVIVREGGTSRSFTLIDGQRKGSLSFSYVIEVRRDRSFTIPALTLRVDGQDYATRPIPIEVVPGAAGGACVRVRPAVGHGDSHPAWLALPLGWERRRSGRPAVRHPDRGSLARLDRGAGRGRVPFSPSGAAMGCAAVPSAPQ